MTGIHFCSGLLTIDLLLATSQGGLPYKPYRYMPSQRVGFFRPSGLKTGMNFAHFGLESGMVFEETTGVNVLIYRFSSK